MKNKTRSRYPSSQKTKRQELKTRQKRRRLALTLGLAAVGIAALALTAFILINRNPQAVGEAVQVMPSADHVPDGTDPGPYNTNPPSSGRHYADSLPAGFYDAAAAAEVPSLPEGYLVHSLEHGYVIFWYNCTLLDEAGCEELSGQLKQLIDEEKNYKVIAFPWEKGETPVAATTWGRMLRFEQFDLQQARAFVKAYRNKAPEPFAD